MSVFRSIATGYLGAKIRNTEANDALKARVLETAGTTLLTETIPDAVAAEKERKSNYDMLARQYSTNFAELADENQFTLNKDTMGRLDEYLKDNELNEEAIKNANFATDFNNRYNQRQSSDAERYDPILKQLGIDGIGSLGYNTVEALVKPESMQTTTKDQMADTVVTEQTPIEYSSMQMGDYFNPMSGTYQIPETEFAKVAQPFRGFQGSITFTQDGGVDFSLPGTKNIEYRALRAVTNDVSSQFLDADDKVNLSQAVEFADKKLKNQTQDVIGTVVNNYKQVSDKGITTSVAQGFSNKFNQEYSTDKLKKQALQEYLTKLGTRSEQLYFVQSFPRGVTFADGKTEVKTYLENLFR